MIGLVKVTEPFQDKSGHGKSATKCVTVFIANIPQSGHSSRAVRDMIMCHLDCVSKLKNVLCIKATSSVYICMLLIMHYRHTACGYAYNNASS